jgi:hypothetical protein
MREGTVGAGHIGRVTDGDGADWVLTMCASVGEFPDPATGEDMLLLEANKVVGPGQMGESLMLWLDVSAVLAHIDHSLACVDKVKGR